MSIEYELVSIKRKEYFELGTGDFGKVFYNQKNITYLQLLSNLYQILERFNVSEPDDIKSACLYILDVYTKIWEWMKQDLMADYSVYDDDSFCDLTEKLFEPQGRDHDWSDWYPNKYFKKIGSRYAESK